MDTPLVSIALCTYNGAGYLPKQLDTLIGQSYPNLEIIAVDDNSGDETFAILTKYAARCNNLKVYRNHQNLGYTKNFQKAISLTTGNLIALADQDDIWELDKIKILADNIVNNLLIYHDSAFIDEGGNNLNKKLSDVRNFYAGNDANIFLFENCVSGHALMFKREMLPYVLDFNDVIIYDHWLAYIACNNGSIAFIDNVLVSYRQHLNANTNILRQNRGEIKKDKPLKKIEKQLLVMQAFAGYAFNKDNVFKQKLLLLMHKRMENYFSFRLAWFIFLNRGVLLVILKKSTASKLNKIIKFAWGYKLKQLLN